MKPIDAPFVFVRWIDAVTKHGWTEAAEDDNKVEEVWSCGWMLHRDRSELRLVSDVGVHDNSLNRRIAIPMGMVEEIREGTRTGPVLFEKRRRKKAENGGPQPD